MSLDHQRPQRIHFIGIGGIGMSALAEILLKKGYKITGSDLLPNQNTERLQQLGIKIRFDHAGHDVKEADVAVYSSAIARDNPEYVLAGHISIPRVKRGDMLAQIMGDYHGIAVSGSHGKTTTAGLLAHILMIAHLDPTFMIGGLIADITRDGVSVSTQSQDVTKTHSAMRSVYTPARLGVGRYCVGEADESDASFLFMHPNVIVVTNIDADHLSHYADDFRQLQASYVQFLSQVSPTGIVILCLDDPVIAHLLPEFRASLPDQARLLTYGFSEQADYSARHYRQDQWTCHVDVRVPNGSELLPITLNMPGQHNALNALGAIAACYATDTAHVSVKDLQRAMATFPGVDRRLGYHGEIAVSGGYATVIDDYGHHPNEIKATLSTVRQAWPSRRIVLVFQPHRYTRTRDLMADFASVLMEADVLLLLDIYSASEAPIAGVSTHTLLEKIAGKAKQVPIFVPTIDLLPDYLHRILQGGDILLLQGAGTIGDAVKMVIERYA